MVEQVGTVFVDCEAGNKHSPAFADVILRRPLSLAPAEVGETGMIEVLSILPSSYPGHALLTEDQGVLTGVDDCPCGRKGRISASPAASNAPRFAAAATPSLNRGRSKEVGVAV